MRIERERNEGCLAKALPHEMAFTLLGRDYSAPIAIRSWAHDRVRMGKNNPDDPEIKEAFACADTMDAERAAIRAELGKRD